MPNFLAEILLPQASPRTTFGIAPLQLSSRNAEQQIGWQPGEEPIQTVSWRRFVSYIELFLGV